MTEPTDQEQYLNIADQCATTATNDLAASILVDGGSGTLRELLNDAADAIRAGWAAPQPTQAQAGAVPLTPKQVAEIADAAHREYDRLVGSGQCAPRWSAVFAHLLERAHGIGIKNGGRHA